MRRMKLNEKDKSLSRHTEKDDFLDREIGWKMFVIIWKYIYIALIFICDWMFFPRFVYLKKDIEKMQYQHCSFARLCSNYFKWKGKEMNKIFLSDKWFAW